MAPEPPAPPCIPVHSWWITDSGVEGQRGDPSLLFPYWSFTKTVIAICALKLSELGQVDLDSPLDGEDYSLRQLLNHTAGLPDYGGIEDYHRAVAADEEPWPRDTLFGRAMENGVLFPPGQGWVYSNVGYMLAREWIESMSGQSFADLVRELVTVPLGLESVEYATTRAQFARVRWPAAARYHPGWVYPGCLMGTAKDAAHLLRGLFQGRLLKSDTLAQMTERHPLGGAIDGRPWTDCGYGLGLMSGAMAGVGRAIGHSGAGPFCVNAVYHFPDRDDPVTVASFTDGCDEGRAEFEAAGIAEP